MSNVHRSKRVAFLLFAVLLFTTGITGAAAGAQGTSRAADDGARVLREYRKDANTMDVTMRSPAVGQDVTMRLFLPKGWSPNSARKWPVLYLMPGCCEQFDYRSWSVLGKADRFLKGKNYIVAMPTEGPNGNYTDWWNYGRYGPPNWEKFHLDEMRQLLERNYHAGNKRSIAGLSAGAYGAMEYASRRPGMFEAAAAFSGILNTRGITGNTALMFGHIRNEQPLFAMWGDPLLHAKNWREHNPYDNAEKLRGTRLFVSAGNGTAGPLDNEYNRFAGLLEAPTLPNSMAFTTKLKMLDIPVTTDYYNGTHSWPYWERELQRALPLLTKGW